MEKAKLYLRIAAIISLVSGVLFSFSIYTFFVLAFSFIFFVLSTQDEDTLIKNQTFVFVMACIFCILNLFTAIFLFLTSGEISGYRKKQNSINGPPKKIKRVIDPEVRKVDILLKLGVGMVFISGILFATTSWNFISDAMKAIALILLGSLFIALSFFTEKKLKLYKTSYIYWILSMSFFLFSIVAILYFGVFSDALNYQGTGKDLAYFLTYLTAIGLSIATYLKFPKNYILYIAYTCFLLAITSLFRYRNVESMMVVAFLSLIILVVLIAMKKENPLFEYNSILVYLLLALILKTIFMGTSTESSVLLACLVNVGIHYYLTISNKMSEKHIDSLIIIYLLLTIGLYNWSILDRTASLIFSMIVTAHTLLIKFNIIKVDENYQNTNYLLYTLASLGFFLNYQTIHSDLSVVVTLFYLITTILLTEEIANTSKIKFAIYIEPVAVALVIASFFQLNIIDQYTRFGDIIAAIAITYCLINSLVKNETREGIYYVAGIIATIACLENSIESKGMIPAIVAILTSCYLFVKSHYAEEKELPLKLSSTYLLMVVCVYNFLRITNVLNFTLLVASLIMIWFLITMILFNKERYIKIITYFTIVVPILDIISYLESTPVWYSIAFSVLILYCTYLVIEFMCKDADSKNVLGLIGVGLSIVVVFTEPSYLAGVYIGIVGLITIFMSFYRKELKGFFYAGIIITVVNIIYRLRRFWTSIPAWLYLLLGGLSLIGFVTYKEIKKMNDKNK